MSRKRNVRENSAIQWLAALMPALAALPSAYFVARSAYYHLILNWHLDFWPVLGVTVAVVVGLVVESLGTVSIFLALTFHRWNRVKGKLKGYDRAPYGLAVMSIVLYVTATVILLAILEAWPQTSAYAPMVFPFMTVLGGTCWAMYDQHRDRLAYHGLSWNWVVLERSEPVQVRKPEPEIESEPVRPETRLDRLDWLVDHFSSDPVLDIPNLEGALGVSRSTIYADLGALEQAGRVSRNDGHVEVIGELQRQ